MKFETIPNINYLWSGLMVEELIRNGINRFCIASGSRSTPLTLSAARCDRAVKRIHFDERGLGYYGLGISSAGRGPAVLISTSGTAVANFLPAVIEASKKKVPLILLTADRPPELRKTGALQTIDQPGIFGRYVKWDFDLPAPDSEVGPEMVLTTMDQAVFMSRSGIPGPVHINCMFREPLAPEPGPAGWREKKDKLFRWLNSEEPYTRYFYSGKGAGIEDGEKLIELINASSNGIIVAGKLKDGEPEMVMDLAEKLGWPVFADLTSGLRLNRNSTHVIHYFDQVLLSETWEKEKIDTVLHLGGRITSKRYYQFIDQAGPRNYITVLGHPHRNDPLHVVSHRVRSTVSDFLNAVTPAVKGNGAGGLTGKFRSCSAAAEKVIDSFYRKSDQLSEIFLARAVSKTIGDGHCLFLSNSMPVRDMDMYAAPEGKRLFIGGNRGASGIDGVIAAACGFSDAHDSPLTLVIGDLAFLHDLNSLALVKGCSNPVTIVVVNNNGGSIFSFLPIADHREHFEKYFITPHGYNFENAAEMFGISYGNVNSKKEFLDRYAFALKQGESMIIEAVVNREKNVALHKELQSVIKKDLDQSGKREE